MKRWHKFVVYLIISLILSSLISIKLDDYFIGTFYTISGILFSIGLSLVVTFSFNGVKNKSYVTSLRLNLKRVRNSYIFFFGSASVSFLIDKYFREIEYEPHLKISKEIVWEPNASLFFLLVIIFTIIYEVVNFLAIQKINEDLFDKLNN